MHSLCPVLFIVSFSSVPPSLPACCSAHVKVVPCPASQFLSVSQNMNVYYHLHTRPPLPPLLSQINTVHTHSPYDFKIQFNIIFPSMPKSSKLSSVLIFKQKFGVQLSVYGSCTCSPSYHPWSDEDNGTVYCSVQILKFLVACLSPSCQYSWVHCLHILAAVFFAVSHQAAHPYRGVGKLQFCTFCYLHFWQKNWTVHRQEL